MSSGLKFNGLFTLRGLDPDGSRWEALAPNGTCYDGLNDALNVMFGAEAQPNFYIGLIGYQGTIWLSSLDTLSSHVGWSEISNVYGGNRPSWRQGPANNGVITSVLPTIFTALAPGQPAGAFLCTSSVGNSGKLWSTAIFNFTPKILLGTQLSVEYTISAEPIVPANTLL